MTNAPMGVAVQRFIVRACPARDHPEYYAWQTAELCLLVGEDDCDRAFKIACETIKKEKWIPIGSFQKDTLVERRVLEQGGEQLVATYREAQARKVVFNRWFDQKPFARKGGTAAVNGPRIGEKFIDGVMSLAGGRRLTEVEANAENSRNADYVIGDSVIELKDLQQEGLWEKGRQDRLAQLLRPLAPGEGYVSLDPDSLSEEQWRQYQDILGRPIQNQVKSAAKQIKASRERLGCARGGVIFLNTGYTSIPDHIFWKLVLRYCTKDTQQIDFVICISTWLLTDGFDSQIFCSFHPKGDGHAPPVNLIHDAFFVKFEALMVEFVRGGLSQADAMLQPMSPVAFNNNGQNFSFNPPMLPDNKPTPSHTRDGNPDHSPRPCTQP